MYHRALESFLPEIGSDFKLLGNEPRIAKYMALGDVVVRVGQTWYASFGKNVTLARRASFEVAHFREMCLNSA